MKIKARKLKPGDVFMMQGVSHTVGSVQAHVEVHLAEGGVAGFPSDMQIEILRPEKTEPVLPDESDLPD